jgi:hypothetical protein
MKVFKTIGGGCGLPPIVPPKEKLLVVASTLKKLASVKYRILKDGDEPEDCDERRLKEYAQNMYHANLDALDNPVPHKKVLTVSQAIGNINWAGEEVEVLKNADANDLKTYNHGLD